MRTDVPATIREACATQLSAAWAEALTRGAVSLPSDGRLVPFALSPDGSSIFGGMYLPAWSGVVQVTTGGQVRRIRQFANPAQDQVSMGAFDGRWLIWAESHSPEDLNDWSLLAWDSARDRVTRLADAPTAGGTTVLGPLIQPAVHDGEAAWIQADATGTGAVHLFNLATNEDQVLQSGSVGPPTVFWQGNLLWQVNDIPHQKNHLVAFSLATHAFVPLPSALTGITMLTSLDATPNLLAWTDEKTVWLWRAGDAKSQMLYQVPFVDHADFIRIAGDLVTWDAVDGPVAVDLRTSALVRLTNNYGYRLTAGSMVLVAEPVGPLKSASGGPPMLRVLVIDAAKLPPAPSCRG